MYCICRKICYSYICDVGTINDTKAVGDDFILTKSNWHLYLPPTDRPLAKSIYLHLSTFNIQTVYWINEIFKRLYLTAMFTNFVKLKYLTCNSWCKLLMLKTVVSCHEHPRSCQDNPLSSQTQTPDFGDRGNLDRRNSILERPKI